MEYGRLTTSQARHLYDRVHPILSFLNRLKARLDERGFDPRSTLYVAAVKASDAMQSLSVEVYYESCSHGVGRASKD